MSHRCFWLLGVVIGSAYVCNVNYVQAQITPDATLPHNSQVSRDSNTFNITGGTQAGKTLLHSFSEFSIPTGAEAIFHNTADIQNIISRVTGQSISQIDGLIKAHGTANLFLINPNGLVFGKNARLELGGSFIGSTASTVKFTDGFEFSANGNSTIPLLTIHVPIGLQFGANPGAIEVTGDGQGQRTVTIQPQLIDTQAGLQVQADKTLALVGGSLYLEGATLKTAGGRIELGSVGENSLVNLIPTNKGFSLSYDAVQNFSKILLTQQTAVDASGAGGGEVEVWGGSIRVFNSQIEASTLKAERGGGINLTATELVEVIADSQGNSGLYAQVYPGATGDAGEVKINTPHLLLLDGGVIDTSTRGAGKAGNLTVNATQKVELINNQDIYASPSSLFAGTVQNSTGDGGNITINTQDLIVKNGANVDTSTYGSGKAGNLTVNATHKVELIGTGTPDPSGLFAGAGLDAIRDGGDITINTQNLFVGNGAKVDTSTDGSGNAGNLTVNATHKVELIGTGIYGPSSLLTVANQQSTGNGGNITINTQQLLVQDGSQVASSTFGTGKGGNLTINADSVQLTGNGLFAYTGSTPPISASLNAKFSSLAVPSTNKNPDKSISYILYPSGLFSSSQAGADGKAGDITINTQDLLVQNGAQVAATTFGRGNGGNLTINSNSVQVIGIGQPLNDLEAADGSIYSSGLLTSSQPGVDGKAGNLTINTQKLLVENLGIIGTQTQGAGKGGDLTIHTQQLLVWNGGYVNSNTFGSGKAGNLTVKADAVQVIGTTANGQFNSRLSSTSGVGLVVNNSDTTGDGGRLKISTGELLVKDGASVIVSAVGIGNAGNLEINAQSIRLDNNANISANTTSKNNTSQEQATISLRSQKLILRRQSNITTNATGGNVTGGNINIDTDVLAAVENSDISANSTDFRGGQININAQAIFGTQFRYAPTPESDITATGANPQLSGTVQINTPEVDPSQGLIPLPETVIDPNNLIAQNPCQRGVGSSFVVTGRGGLPINPSQALRSPGVRVGLVEPTSPSTTQAQQTTELDIVLQPNYPKTKMTNSIVEAQGWVINDKGEIMLTADNTTGTNYQNNWRSPNSCSAS